MLTDRTILITGAAGGLGREIALTCARQGASLILSDFDHEGLERTRDAVATLGADARCEPLDLSDPAAIAAFGARIEGPLHGLINNGAIATGIGGIPFDGIDIDVWDKVMAVNVRGTWLMIRAMAGNLAASGSGRIVNLASDTALWGAPNLLAYTASKGAVMSMTRSLSRELGPKRIGVTTVAPGILTTPSTDYVPRARHDLYETGRAVPGPVAAGEVTETIAFLVSEGALTLTGQTLPVNHGFVFN
ncbi:SDR family oxidoreductase [Jannaschia sp. 2305UL9-9]|uniref:SDR family oxidoreductase n=1 Tax=Jannaschia sp. 2305UL9-9 TaxID=3121638 RepID=UPI003529C43E